MGGDKSSWQAQDACELILAGPSEQLPILVDQGNADDFLLEQLKPHALSKACGTNNHPLDLRMREGYDHSYFFIATFIGEHIAYHATKLAG